MLLNSLPTAPSNPATANHDSALDVLDLMIATLDREGRVVKANRAWRKFLAINGKSEGDWMERSYVELVTRWLDATTADRDALLRDLGHVIAGVSQIAEGVIRVGSQRLYLSIRCHAMPEGGALLVLDNVTAKKDSERLRVRFESMIDASTDATLIIEADGAVAYANDAARRLIGDTPEEATANIGDLLDHAALAIAESDGVWRGEVTLHTIDGAEVPVVQVVQRHESSVGMNEPSYFTVVLHDISAEKAREEELHNRNVELQLAYSRLRSAQDQLLQSEKMASIGQLAAGVAHEINNPIGYVHSNLGTLQDYTRALFAMLSAQENALRDAHLDETARREIDETRKRLEIDYLSQDLPNLVAESREGIERVRKIVQDLKDFSHGGRGDEWEIVDLHRGLESTLNIVWNELKYKAEVDKEFGAMPPVECLVSQVNQVFLNLLVNAAQAIPERGVIKIRTGATEREAWVSISDNGQGIDPKILARIFDPFFTTKPVGQGTGLGLSLSYSIISKHNGRIEVDSKPGLGTTFRIVLPLRQPRPGQGAPAEQIPVPALNLAR